MSDPKTQEHHSPAWHDAMYNNRALVPDYADYFGRWQAASLAVRTGQPCALDIPYGGGAGETLDVFPASGQSASGVKAPVLVFIHGGYWRSLDKADHSFVVPPFTARGACVVVVNYALCPGTAEAPVTVPDICLQMVEALGWTYRNIAAHGGDPSRITVVGHSAGGHLAAMLLACEWSRHAPDLPDGLVKGALSISGLYELESIRRAPFLQESLQLTPQQVLQCSPAWFAAPRRGCLFTVAGGDESAEFLRQNRLIQKAWGRKLVPVCLGLPGLNHFSVLDALVDPGHRLHQMALDLL